MVLFDSCSQPQLVGKTIVIDDDDDNDAFIQKERKKKKFDDTVSNTFENSSIFRYDLN